MQAARLMWATRAIRLSPFTPTAVSDSPFTPAAVSDSSILNLDAARRGSFEPYGFARVLAFDCHGLTL